MQKSDLPNAPIVCHLNIKYVLNIIIKIQLYSTKCTGLLNTMLQFGFVIIILQVNIIHIPSKSSDVIFVH